MTRSRMYDITRVVLMLLVVFAHGSRMYSGGVYTPVNDSFVLRLLTAIIYAFHMPAFFMLSGCQWGYQAQKGKYRNAGTFLLKKAKTLLLPYLVIGMGVVAPTMVGLGLTEDTFIDYLWEGILLGTNNRHLWYLTALFWMFVLTVPLREMLLSQNIWVTAGVLFGSILLSGTNCLPGYFQLNNASKYWVFFVAGIYMDRYWDHLFPANRKWRAGMVALLCLCILSLRTFQINDVLFYVFAFAGSFALFTIVSLMPIRLTQFSAFKKLRVESYGIYLFHPMLIYLMFAYTWFRNIHPWVLCCSICLLALLLSMWLSAGVRKLGLGIVIGEPVKKQ